MLESRFLAAVNEIDSQLFAQAGGRKVVRQNVTLGARWGGAECGTFREWSRLRDSYLFCFQRCERL